MQVTITCSDINEVLDMFGYLSAKKSEKTVSLGELPAMPVVPSLTVSMQTEVETTTPSVAVQSAPPQNATAQEPTLDSVKTVFAKLIQGGGTDKAKGILKKYGATKISELQPSVYLAVMAEAQNA